MGTSQPIRNKEELQKLKEYYYKKEPNLRNYVLICLGINSALRISDLLHLKWKDVYDFERKAFRYHIIITGQKTKKETRIAINRNASEVLALYKEQQEKLSKEAYLFSGREGAVMPLSRSQAFRIIRHASEALHLEKESAVIPCAKPSATMHGRAGFSRR